VLLGLVTIVGLVLLVVPGIVAYTYFSLIGPLITSEGLGIRAAFRRSARLVRGHFWLVLVLVTIPLGVEEALIGIVEEIDIAHELAAVVLLQVVLAVGVTALVGLVAVTLAYELAGRESPGEELLESR
jgi:hypothetical protein